MNELIVLLKQPWTHRVGWVLFHSLWEGALTALAYAVLRALLRRQSANARYLAGCALLACLALAPILTVYLGAGSTFYGSSGASASGSSWAARELEGRADPVPAAPIRSGGFDTWEHGMAAAEGVMPWLVLAWIAGVSGFSARWLQGSWWLRNVKRAGAEPLEAIWLEKLDELKRRLQISRPVRLVKSVLVEVPMVAGWLRPVILLPAATLSGLTPAQLEVILAHELVHLRRWDYLVNAFQNVLETLMFYHPAVWWISRCVRDEREHCCDDAVVQLCGNRVVYARALYTLEVMRGHPRLAFAATGGSLLARIRRLLGSGAEARPAAPRELGGLVLVALGCALFVVGAILAFRPGTFQAQALIRIEPDSTRLGPGRGAPSAPVYYDPFFLDTELAVMRSPAVLGRLVKSSGAGPLSDALALARLRSHLAFRAVRGTSLGQVVAYDPNATEAARLANAVASAYQDYRNEQGSRKQQEAFKGLELRLKETSEKINAAEEKAEKLRLELGIPAANAIAGPGQNAAGGSLMTSETLRRVEGLRIESEAELTRQETLLEQLSSAEQKLVGLSNEFGPNHPERLKVQAQTHDLQTRIKQRTEGALLGLEAKVASMKESLKQLDLQIDNAKAQDNALASRSIPYWQAKRNLEELQRFHQLLMDKLASDRTELYEPARGQVEVVESAAVPLRRVNPARDRGMALIGAGVLLALAGIWLARSVPGMLPEAVPA